MFSLTNIFCFYTTAYFNFIRFLYLTMKHIVHIKINLKVKTMFPHDTFWYKNKSNKMWSKTNHMFDCNTSRQKLVKEITLIKWIIRATVSGVPSPEPCVAKGHDQQKETDYTNTLYKPRWRKMELRNSQKHN